MFDWIQSMTPPQRQTENSSFLKTPQPALTPAYLFSILTAPKYIHTMPTISWKASKTVHRIRPFSHMFLYDEWLPPLSSLLLYLAFWTMAALLLKPVQTYSYSLFSHQNFYCTMFWLGAGKIVSYTTISLNQSCSDGRNYFINPQLAGPTTKHFIIQVS